MNPTVEFRFCKTIRAAGLSALLLVATNAHAATVFQGATLFDGNGGPALENASIRIDEDRIVCIGTGNECSPEPGDTVLDVSGQFITPGLVDAHVHFSQTGWLDGRPHWAFLKNRYDYEQLQRKLQDNPDRWHRTYLCSGITAVYDVGGLPWTIPLADPGDRTSSRAVVRAAGPLITHAEVNDLIANGQNTFLPMGTDAEALASVEQLVDLGADAIKVWYLDPPLDQREELDRRLMRIGDAAREHGLPMLVHATELRNAKVALRAGASILVHSVEDAPVDREFIALAQANDVVYLPTLLAGPNWRRARASVGLGVTPSIDDPNGCVDDVTREVIGHAPELHDAAPSTWRDVGATFTNLEQSGQSLAVMQNNLLRVSEAGITIATATDAGNPLTLHGPSIYAEMEAMQAAGIPAERIIVMSTRNGAMAMGMLDDIGTLETGKVADLVLLRENPADSVSAFRSISHVMRAGTLHEVSELAAGQNDPAAAKQQTR